MRGRIVLGLLAPAVIATVVVTAALGTPPSGLVGTPLTRGTVGEFSIHDASQTLQLEARDPLDIALVRATLTAGGFTGWHRHNGPSLIVVSAGSLTVYEPNGKECNATTYGQGSAFVHPEDAHNGVAGSSGVEFYIVYLLPQGASAAPLDVTPAPDVCA